MNQLIWAAMREYIQAEVKLALAERFMVPTETLREQVTRFETEVRRLIDELPRGTSLNEDQVHALNMFVPYGAKAK